MDSTAYTIDPEGEVIIILRNANSPFAQLTGDACTRPWFHFSELSFGKPLSSQGLTGIPRFSLKPLDLGLKEQSDEKKYKKDKKQKRRDKKRRVAAEETAVEATAAEVPPAETPASEEPAVEEVAVEEPAVEATAAEVPPTEAPAAEEPACEEPAVEEVAAEVPPAEAPTADGHFNHSCSRIQVSAKHLMFASPVFKRLLTGGWKESIAYFQKGSVEITADGWDVEALIILLRAIHGQCSQIPRKLTLEMLAKLAVIADYYECREALYFLTELWIEKLDERVPPVASRDLILWLWIAWFFRLPSQFKLSTSIAMSQSDGFIDSLGLPIPKDVIVSINERREKAIENLIDFVDETCKSFLLGARGCRLECRSIMYGALAIQSNDLLLPKPECPSPNLNYKSLVQRVMAFQSPEWHASSSGYSGYSGYSSYGSNYKHRCADASFASIFGALEEVLEGLELDQFTSP